MQAIDAGSWAELVCRLCNALITQGHARRIQSGHAVHNACLNARVALSRMAQANPALKKALYGIKENDPEKHAGILAALRTEEVRTRTPAQRQHAKAFVDTMTHNTSASRQQG